MQQTKQISGVSLYAVLSAMDRKEEVEQLLAKEYSTTFEQLKSQKHWLSLEEWCETVEKASQIPGSNQEACHRGGEKCKEFGLMGPVEYLPWFLSSPVLAMRNLGVILGGVDRLTIPVLEYLGPRECNIILVSRSGRMLPPKYAAFLMGYLRCLVEMWPEVEILDFRREQMSQEKAWHFSIDWNLESCREVRALEELLLEPNFFYELFEGFRKIDPGNKHRRQRLLEVHSMLRNLQFSHIRESFENDKRTSALKRELTDLRVSLFDGQITIDSEGENASLDDIALRIMGYSSQEAFLRRYPSLDDFLEMETPRETTLHRAIEENWGREFLVEMEEEKGGRCEKLFTLPSRKRAELNGKTLVISRERIFHSRNYLELGKSNQFLESMLSYDPSGIMILDSEGRVVQMNPQLEKMLNQTEGNILADKSFFLKNDPVIRQTGLDDDLLKAFSGQNVDRSSVNLYSDAREQSLLVQNLRQPLVVNLKMYPLADRAGNIFNVIVIFIDITESFMLNQHVSQLDKMQSIATLASGIAHDFNNILGAIVPNADFINQMAEGQPHIQKKAQTIKQAAKRAASLTQQLLSYSRESKAVRKELSVHACVSEAVNLISNAIPKTISIFYEPSLEDISVHADPLQMQQVLINLLINASDASPKGGDITVKVSKKNLDHKVSFGGNIIEPGEFACLSVTDQGTGMEQELIEKVFNPFFTTKDKGRGTGLGLSVVHGIIKAHRGFVEIFSRLGTGTRFDVHFPLGRN